MGVFHFKRFDVDDSGCGMKICSDSVLLAAWLLPGLGGASSLLDAGTGSGVLALLAADILPDVTITGVEIDPVAAQAAADNFMRSPWAGRLRAVCDDYCRYVDSHSGAFDIIISNPPYFVAGGRSSDPARAFARHQDSLSYNVLMSCNKLSKGGVMGLVSPADLENDIIASAEFAGMKLHRMCRVQTVESKAPTRILWHFSNIDAPVQYSTLIIRKADGTYTDAYRQLVEPYYQKL